MKIFGSCHRCREQTNSFPITSDFVWNELGELNDDAVASGSCPHGHLLYAIVQSTRHVLLFDSACLAYLDGYYREAIGTFAASLERFYEFAVRVIYRHRGVDPSALDGTWKALSHRSEAQLGAFLLAYSLHTGSAAPAWEHEKTRNDIVHKGLFLSKERAFTFGAACYERIMDVTDELRRSAANALEAEVTDQFAQRAARQQRAQGVSPQTICMGTSPVAVEMIRTSRPSFQEALDFLERHPMWFHPADRLSVAQVARNAKLSVHEVYALANNGQLARHLRRAIQDRRAQARGSRSIDRVLRQRRPTTLSGRLR